MTHPLPDLTGQLLELAQKAGADAADAIAVAGTSLMISTRNGQLEDANRSENVDIGLRVILGNRQACVSSSDVKPDTLAQMVERAITMAREAPEDPYVGLADPSQLATNTDCSTLELFDPSAEPDPSALHNDALRAEAAAMRHAGITKIDAAKAGYSHNHIHTANSIGFSAGYIRTERAISCVAIGGSGTNMERDYDYDSRVMQNDLRDAEAIGTLAAQRTIARIGARKPKTGAFPVVFDERVASSLISSLLQTINGTMIARGSSWLRDAMGTQILPKGLSLIEDPHRTRVNGSRLFDAEGLATQKRAIVEDGTLKSWTLDLATARQLALESTANAVRGTSTPPSPQPSNIMLTAGDKTQQELISQMGTGLFVTAMIGSTINPNTGDYSRGAAGFWVENGEITYPVNECTLAGNLRDMLMTIIPANDARTYLSRVVPSLLVEGLTLAGT